MTTLWTQRYAQRTQRMQSSAVRELLKLTEHPEMISFAGGLPASDVFPVDRFQEAVASPSSANTDRKPYNTAPPKATGHCGR